MSAAAQDRLPGADDGRMYLPIGVERYRWFATPTGPVRSHARIRPPHVRGDMMVLDIRIESADGAPVAQIDGLRCRRASRDMFRRRTDALVADWLYAPVWKVDAHVADRPIAGRWLVFDEGEGRGERLAAEIARRGGSALRVIPGPGYTVCGDRAEIDPGSADHLTRLLAEAAGDAGVAGVVSLWPLRVPPLGDDDVPSAGQRFGTDAALLLVQALAAAPAPLWLVTTGTEVVDGCETPCIEQAPVAGFARVAALEHPELRVTHVDLDPQATAADSRELADELAADSVDAERRVAMRKGIRHVARLARLARPTAPPVDAAPTRLHIGSRGTLENLAIGPGRASRARPRRGRDPRPGQRA